MKPTNQGFTLIELMITLAIIGILAAIVLPQYQTYAQHASFTEVFMAVKPFKTSFEIGVHTGRITNISQADDGTFGIPTAAGASGNIASVTVTNGVITATAAAGAGGFTYILTPNGIVAPVQWFDDGTVGTAGTCLAAAVC
jgi:type IV pilus assembly protein PilA